MATPLSVMTWEEYVALPLDTRRERARQAEKYRRSGREEQTVRALRSQIVTGWATCAECGSAERLSVDHVHPVILGGTHDFDNLQILCRSCNSRKKART